MVDRYTKIILTIIAFTLCVLIIQNSVPTATAVGHKCGDSSWTPCYVHVTGGSISVSGSVYTY